MSAMLTYLAPIVRSGKTFYGLRARGVQALQALDKPANWAICRNSFDVLGPPDGSRPSTPEDATAMADTAPYHDRDGFIWYDGKLVPWREANLHVLSHGLHYASAVFEGERAYGGVIFELTQHSQRLSEGAKTMDFTIPYSVAEIDQACRDADQGQQAHRLLRAAHRLARQRDDGRLGAVDQDPSGHRRLGLGLLLPHGAAPQGHPHDHRPVSPARPRHGARQDQGRRPLHDLHAREAPRRAHGLCRRPDVRLARPCRRVHGRQHLLRQGRRAQHADARLLPRRHHAAHRHRPGQEARA